MEKISRIFELNLPQGKSAFLWGPRKVGKSFWIKENLKDVPLIDLLKTDVFADYASRPALLRERYAQHQGLIVLDEVQKVPALLDEVHWLIENSSCSFLLTGSSARKLRRGHANLLGGRAWRRTMHPLCFAEIPQMDIEHVALSGLLPEHYLSEYPQEELRAYLADYLKEEIVAEALTENIPAFSEFLRVAAISSSALLSYSNVAREVGLSQSVVRQYFDILQDTYLGFRVAPWKKSHSRRMIQTEKFYLFDVGVANYLARRQPRLGSPEFGQSFEHFILMELKAYQAYRNPELPLAFWRTSTGQEVDFIVGDKELALEITASSRVHVGKLKGLKSLLEDGPVKKAMVVCMETQPRIVEPDIEICPWNIFLERLWAGEFGF